MHSSSVEICIIPPSRCVCVCVRWGGDNMQSSFTSYCVCVGGGHKYIILLKGIVIQS